MIGIGALSQLPVSWHKTLWLSRRAQLGAGTTLQFRRRYHSRAEQHMRVVDASDYQFPDCDLANDAAASRTVSVNPKTGAARDGQLTRTAGYACCPGRLEDPSQLT